MQPPTLPRGPTDQRGPRYGASQRGTQEGKCSQMSSGRSIAPVWLHAHDRSRRRAVFSLSGSKGQTKTPRIVAQVGAWCSDTTHQGESVRGGTCRRQAPSSHRAATTTSTLCYTPHLGKTTLRPALTALALDIRLRINAMRFPKSLNQTDIYWINE